MSGRGTSNHDLNHKMRLIKGYKGAVSVDQIPPRLRKGESIIVNLEDSSQGGSHWVCVIVLPKFVLYFCPFGGSPDPRVVSMMERSRGRRMIINTSSQYQMDDADSCGHFCVYTLTRLQTPSDLYTVLYEDLDPLPTPRNEKTVRKFWSSL